MKEVRRNVLLNPGPATTTDTVKSAQVVPDICPRETEFGDLTERVQKALVRVVNGGDEYEAVLFGGSGTAAVEACLSSVVPRDGRILIVDNGAYGKRMIDIATLHGIEIVPYRIPWGDFPDVEAVERLLAEGQGSITHLAVVHHETTTGMLNPIDPLIEAAHRHGAEVILDTISSYAGIPLDVSVLRPEFLTSTSNKNIQGMAGVGFVICRKDALAKTAAIPPRCFYLNLWGQYTHFENTHQFSFTPPVQTLFALEQAVKEYEEETGPGRFQRYRACYETILQGMEALGFRCLLPREQHSGLLTSFIEPHHEAYAYDAMHDFLYARGFTIYPGKGAKEATFRLANIGQIHPADIENFLDLLKTYLEETGMAGALYR